MGEAPLSGTAGPRCRVTSRSSSSIGSQSSSISACCAVVGCCTETLGAVISGEASAVGCGLGDVHCTEACCVGAAALGIGGRSSATRYSCTLTPRGTPQAVVSSECCCSGSTTAHRRNCPSSMAICASRSPSMACSRAFSSAAARVVGGTVTFESDMLLLLTPTLPSTASNGSSSSCCSCCCSCCCFIPHQSRGCLVSKVGSWPSTAPAAPTEHP